MNLSNYVMHSGGAIGSDIAWHTAGIVFGLENINHYWHGKKTPHGNFQLNDQEIEEGYQHVLIANQTLKRRPEKFKSLLGRNWWQVKHSFAVFAIGTLQPELKQANGGTGWAVQMAIDNGKPVYFFDQNSNEWCKYSYDFKEFMVIDYTPELTQQFAGIGTRDLKPNGIYAIDSVYKETIKQINNENS